MQIVATNNPPIVVGTTIASLSGNGQTVIITPPSGCYVRISHSRSITNTSGVRIDDENDNELLAMMMPSSGNGWVSQDLTFDKSKIIKIRQSSSNNALVAVEFVK